MRNCVAIATFMIVALFAIGDASPARKRMVYYQQPAQFYGAPQRLMYVQHIQPSSGYARSAQSASALVAGETVATGTYLEDCNHAESDVAAAGPAVEKSEDTLSDAGVHSSQAVAEAYPDDSSAVPAPPSRAQTAEVETEQAVDIAADVPVDAPIESDNEAKVPRVYSLDANEPASASANLPAPAPLAPIATPANRYLPSKKKVYVELDSSEPAEVEEPDVENAVANVEDEENQAEDEETDVAAVVPVVAAKKPSARRPAAKKPAKPAKDTADCAACAKAGSSGSSKPQLPAGTFFPIDFGGTMGGAIAIANAFSTGENGSATSHATAYGSPDLVRVRHKPSKLH